MSTSTKPICFLYRSLAIWLLLCIGMVFPAFSQTSNKPVSNTLPAAAAVAAKPAAYISGIPLNYVRSWQPLVPMTTEQAVLAGDNTTVLQATQYADGLGRPLQTVARGISPAGLDLVSPVIYDAFGREVYKYLPYAAENNGLFKNDPFTQQKSFMEAQYAGEQVYYSQTDYEASPLNRVMKNYAPGNSWAGSGRGIGISYEVSVANEVAIWNIEFEEGVVPGFQGYYAAGELYRTVNTDERGKRVVEYKNKEGQVVLKKVEIATNAPAIASHDGWLCTYYVYDNLNQLRFVIPPLAVEAFKAGGWNLAGRSNDINELCFQYAYDDRSRMIAKRVPGTDWLYMVYDVRDRLVFTQDGNMRLKQQWMATIYDNQNRPVQTGMLSYGGSRSVLQEYVTGLGNNPVGVATSNYSSQTSGTPSILYVTSHDGRPLYKATNEINFEGNLEGSGEFETDIITPDGIAFTSSQELNMNPVSPLLSGATGYIPLTFTYYDDYSWTSKRYNASNNNKLGIGSNAWGDPLPGGTNEQVKGLVTGTRVRVLENPGNLNQGAWLETASFYDDKGRVAQVQAENYKGGLDISTNRYDFTGKVISSYAVHNNPSGFTSNRIYTEMKYDHGGRLTEVLKTLNDNIETRRVIARHEYDALGQLKKKELGQQAAEDNRSAASGYLETQDYSYNIRGWLKGLNWGSNQPGNSSGRWFGMDLSYDWGYEHNQYNGNIAGMRWKSKGDGAERSYGYTYDAASRLLLADFKQLKGTDWNNDAGLNFTAKMGSDGTDNGTAYDANGNIKQMQQWGVLPGGGSEQIDNLQYQYFNYSNKLRSVSDLITADHKLGDFVDRNTDGDDYSYDVNGNLVKDKNKRIAKDEDPAGAILYNHLNLPWQITVKDESGPIKGTITYIYDATGNKLEKRVDELPLASNNQQAKHTYTTYLAGHVYENNVLQFFSHEEGRIRLQRNTAGIATGIYYYDYFIKDHLGNVRMVLTDEHQTDAYPVASLEAAALNNEKLYYDIPDGGRVLSGTFPASPFASDPNNAYVQVLNGNGQKTGTAIVLKVMSGDKVNIQADSWYGETASPGSQSGLGWPDLIASLAGGIAGTGAGSHSAAMLQQNQNLQTGLGSFLTNVVNADYTANGGNKPKAYLNYVLFDEQLNAVITGDGSNSGVSAVGAAGEQYSHVIAGRSITRNGYLYVFVSNETSGANVIFDNLQVTHARGALTEETHYYPFGLTMAGISSKAARKLQNRLKFNDGTELENGEFSDGKGLDLYATEFRRYDGQIGRFIQIDPLAQIDFNFSPYLFADNNPIIINDPLGLTGDTILTYTPEKTPGFNVYNPANDLETVVVRTVKPLDTENGQVLRSLSTWERIWGPTNGRGWGIWHVNSDGYLTGRLYTPVRQLIFTAPVDRNPIVSAKALFRLKNFIKGRYAIYRGMKDGLPYIGKAKESIKLRYSEEVLQKMHVEVLAGLDNVPNNAIALGVEQLVIDLNGGVGSGGLSNVNNATIKEIYINEARHWLDLYIPNWEDVLKFQ